MVARKGSISSGSREGRGGGSALVTSGVAHTGAGLTVAQTGSRVPQH